MCNQRCKEDGVQSRYLALWSDLYSQTSSQDETSRSILMDHGLTNKIYFPTSFPKPLIGFPFKLAAITPTAKKGSGVSAQTKEKLAYQYCGLSLSVRVGFIGITGRRVESDSHAVRVSWEE